MAVISVVIFAFVLSGVNAWNETSGAWTKSNAPSGSWTSVASDTAGRKLIATSSDYDTGGLYQSLDSGANWKKLFVSGSGAYETWTAVASSGDGTVLYALQQNFGLYIAQSGGKSWTNTIVDLSLYYANYNGVTCNANGAYVAVTASYGYVYVSSNFGYSFIKASAPAESWMFIQSSLGGEILIAGASSMYVSSDWGHTFKKSSAPAQNWRGVTFDSTSRYVVAAAGGSIYSDYAYGGIYTSSDGGTTWTATTGADRQLNWISVSVDVYNVKSITAAASGSGIWSSVDGGKNFIKSSSASTTESWRQLAASTNNLNIVAISSGSAGGIYYFHGDSSLNADKTPSTASTDTSDSVKNTTEEKI